VVLNSLFQFEECAEKEGKVIGRLQATGSKLVHTQKLGMAGIRLEHQDRERGES
jgi:pilus assembly protein CpaF